MSARRWLLRALAGCACLTLAYAQGDVSPAVLERWGNFSEQERDVLRDRFERFRALDPVAQDALRERHSSLRDAIDRHVATLPAAQRAELAELSTSERKRVVRDLFHANSRFESGLRGREGMAAMLERLRGVEPELRPHLLKRTCSSLDRSLSPERLEDLGFDLDLAPEAFEALGVEERRELFRARIAERFGEGRRGWDDWRSGRRGSDRDWSRDSNSEPNADPNSERDWERDAERDTDRDRDRDWSWHSEGDHDHGHGSWGERWGSGERSGSDGGYRRGAWGQPPALVELPGLTAERAQLLVEAARPRVSDFAELDGIERDERQRRTDERVRGRLLAAAADMPPELRDQLGALDVPLLVASLRAALPE